MKIAAKYVQKEAAEACFEPQRAVVNICVTEINIFKNLFLAVQFGRSGCDFQIEYYFPI